MRRGAVEARDVLDARLQVSARVASALRTLLRDGDALSVLRCLDDLDKALRGMPLGETRGRQGERFHAPVARAEVVPDRPSGSLQDRLAEVERRLTISEAMHEAHEDHFGLLDQRIAGLGNALDEARPAAPASAAERPRVSWTWADEGTAGWLRTTDGAQAGGAHEGNDGWYWWTAREAGGYRSLNIGPMTKEAAIASAVAAVSPWAEIQS